MGLIANTFVIFPAIYTIYAILRPSAIYMEISAEESSQHLLATFSDSHLSSTSITNPFGTSSEPDLQEISEHPQDLEELVPEPRSPLLHNPSTSIPRLLAAPPESSSEGNSQHPATPAPLLPKAYVVIPHPLMARTAPQKTLTPAATSHTSGNRMSASSSAAITMRLPPNSQPSEGRSHQDKITVASNMREFACSEMTRRKEEEEERSKKQLEEEKKRGKRLADLVVPLLEHPRVKTIRTKVQGWFM